MEIHSHNIQLLPEAELKQRLGRVKEAISAAGADSALLTDNATIIYLTGRVFTGYIYLHTADERPLYIVRRPHDLSGERMVKMQRFDQLLGELKGSAGVTAPKSLGLELGCMPYATASRIIDGVAPVPVVNISPAIRTARSVKTAMEIKLMKESGLRQARVYQRLPHFYHSGMTDIELQIEAERLARLDGCLGIFRVNGHDMEIFMGNTLTGENADTPTPYDFALGGAGLNPSIPVGADGSVIMPHQSVMVDLNGNYTGYMTDMTRCYSVGAGDMAQKAKDAHRLSIDIVESLSDMARPGTEAKTLYEHALKMVEQAGMTDYFMGHHSHAGFAGHGVGIEINEGPVLAPRSKDILAAGNTIALEPKFVIPGTGAVGIEDTIVVNAEGPAECITVGQREIINLEP